MKKLLYIAFLLLALKSQGQNKDYNVSLTMNTKTLMINDREYKINTNTMYIHRNDTVLWVKGINVNDKKDWAVIGFYNDFKGVIIPKQTVKQLEKQASKNK